MRHPDGVWAGYTYEWNSAQTAATRVVGGKTRTVNGQSWIYPSESDCRQCHTAVAGFSLGLGFAGEGLVRPSIQLRWHEMIGPEDVNLDVITFEVGLHFD
jgi:hypothetical protein